MKTRLFWCITLYLLCHPQVWGQKVTSEFPPSRQAVAPQQTDRESALPAAKVVPQPAVGVPVEIIANTQSEQSLKSGTLYTLNGNVVIHYRGYIVHADHATYNDGTGVVVARGHLMIDGGPDDEHLTASHGTLNLNQDTGDLFDVVGTVSNSRKPRGRMVFMAPNPFAITGKEVQQLGRGHYRVIHGTMTSCRLPKPDWRILAGSIQLNHGVASTSGAWFQLFHLPILYLPYVTHPVNVQRSSGVLIPVFGNDTTRGFIVGEGLYMTLGRSADLTMATQYWSKRGFAPSGMFRYRGLRRNFANVHFESLLDHGLLEPNGTRVNQGGVDLAADGRYDFTPHTRGIIDAEYLSSYVYRLVFEENYAVAIDSEVKSQIFATHEHRDTWASLHASRYQEFQSSTIPGDEVRILHMPEIDFETADHSLAGSRVLWSFRGTAGALSRYDYPNFRTTAEVPRVDFYPHLSMPVHFAGWTFRPRAAFRETWYGKSQYPTTLEQIPVVRGAGITRTDVEAGFDLRPPAIEKDFTAPWLRRLAGGDVRHVVEPDVEYRYVTGINNFQQILRFDQTDVASNTNEIEYGVTQRFFVRDRKKHPCGAGENSSGGGSEPGNGEDISDQSGESSGVAEVMGWGISAAAPPGHNATSGMCNEQTRDWVTWRVAQKYYFEPDFGHALTPGTPNPLSTTLDFTGVDFLTEPRNTTPLISRLRLQTTKATDVEWDLDYDAREGKITSSNVFAAFRRGLYRLQFGDAYMNVPLGVTPLSTRRSRRHLYDASTQYNQIHLSAIHGTASKLGLSEGVSTAYDLVHQQLQYGAAQAQYNWNCCGLDFQYRKFVLGPLRNDTEYFYSFNLAGISNIGDLRRRISIF